MHLLRNQNNVPSIYPSIRPSGSVGLNDAVAVLAGGEKARDVCSVVMFCFDLFQKFRLPIGLHSSCSIGPMAGETFQKRFAKYHD